MTLEERKAKIWLWAELVTQMEILRRLIDLSQREDTK